MSYIKLALVPVALFSFYTAQSQIQQQWLLISLYIGSCLSMFSLVAWKQVQTPLKFAYACFLKPLGDHGNDQQSRLESSPCLFFLVYDHSRHYLLKGRETMLKLCAAQLKQQIESGKMDQKPIWVDLGGGTGWNIEAMNDSFPIERFEKVILVDLTPSLCQVARERFERRGWKNVIVLCQDAATFQLEQVRLDGHVGLVTISYALSMMDHFYPVVDRIQTLLSPEGVIGVIDFYVSGKSRAPAENWAPQQNRQCSWLLRHFWQMWFELDHIQLAPGRRDYLEYKFGTIKSLNHRNHFIVPYLIQMPYYIWLGCSHTRQTESVQEDNESVSSQRSVISQTSTGSFVYQNRFWRLDYNPLLPCHTQFRSYIYAFTWEDPSVDLAHLDLTQEDTLFVITSAGDNALEYALHSQPKVIHCIDMNPCQNHLLELKLAGISSLDYQDFWRMFGDGYHPNFSDLLHDTLSPHLSAYAFQYWSQHSDRFSHKFYKTGYSGLALSLVEWWVRMQGLGDAVDAMVAASTIEAQQDIWLNQLRPAILSPFIQKVLQNPVFMWNALGVPINQMNMFLEDCTCQEYIENTLDPIPSRSLFKNDQYFYYLCLKQSYSTSSCPSYLTKEGFHLLKTSGALDAFRLHTESILTALQGLSSDYLTRLIVMDHMDWFDPNSCEELESEIIEMKRTLKSKGQVYWRSAGTKPWYNHLFIKHGFHVEPLAIRAQGKSIDRVNMYASFYRATRP
ncbi:hypothetical protein BY458DRAFT_438106 [Sporodiniella umbellata]|nr:hypothetical protein BY458DRAFT_438106 [Sporodiniella umbellata]